MQAALLLYFNIQKQMKRCPPFQVYTEIREEEEMKRRFIVLMLCVLTLVLLAGCGKKEVETPSDLEIDGTFTAPDGWEQVVGEPSSSQKAFYVKEGTDISETPSNISIEQGVNQYTAEDHVQFRQAILRQLSSQVPKGTKVDGDGSFTEKEKYPVYTFTVTEESGTVTTQYYIVGDKKYILVHSTNFPDKPADDIDDAAEEIVNSFKWN